MTPEEWQRVRPILESAFDLDCTMRPAFLEETCADPSLRCELESLIAAHERAGTDVLNGVAVPGFVGEDEALAVALEVGLGYVGGGGGHGRERYRPAHPK